MEDLLGFNSPQPAAAVPPVDAGATGDLLGFNAPAADLLSFNAPAVAAPAAAVNADFANFAAAPPAAPAVPANADWCDFASFNSAPAPATSGGYNSTAMPAVAPKATAPGAVDLIGFDFADPLAPSPAPTRGPLK